MDSTIRDLFRSLELTLQERLRTIEDVIRAGGHHPSNPNAISVEERLRRLENAVESFQASHFPHIGDAILQFRVELDNLRRDIAGLRAADPAPAPASTNPLIPQRPLEGLEVIPKREVAIPVTPPAAMSAEDRLLLNKKAREVMEIQEGLEDRLLMNKKARKALEAEEMGEGLEEHAELDENEIVDSDVEGDGEEGGLTEEVEVEVEEEGLAEETEEVEVEESEAEEAEEEGEAEELELEEFEYKGSTYYRDGENNVYMMDEEGELQQDPIGVWNEAKQRIVVKKPAAA